MREVNNNTTNTGNVNFQGIQPRKEELHAEMPMTDSVEVTDLGKMPSEIIGRSQVSKTAHSKDVEFFMHNPEKAEKFIAICDKLQDAGYSYEQACAIVSQMAEEFSNR